MNNIPPKVMLCATPRSYKTQRCKCKLTEGRPPLCKSCGECQYSGLGICPFSASAPQGGNTVAQDGSLVHTAAKVGDRVAPDQFVAKADSTVAQAGNLVHRAVKVGNRVAQAGNFVHTAAMAGNTVAQNDTPVKVGNRAAPDQRAVSKMTASVR